MDNLRGDPISLRRVRPESEESSGHTFERLEAAVAELADSRRQLKAENVNLRDQLHEQGQRIQGLDERLLEANQRRQDALKRIDDLIARLDQIDSRFGTSGAVRTNNVSRRTD